MDGTEGETTLKACPLCGDIQELSITLLWKECPKCQRAGFRFRYMTYDELLSAAREDARTGFAHAARAKASIAARLKQRMDRGQ